MQVYLHILIFNKCSQCTRNCTWLHIREIATGFVWSPLQCEKELEQLIGRTPFVMHLETFKVVRIFINDAISEDFRAQKIPFDLFVLKHFFKQQVLLFCIVNCRE